MIFIFILNCHILGEQSKRKVLKSSKSDKTETEDIKDAQKEFDKTHESEDLEEDPNKNLTEEPNEEIEDDF